MARLKLRGERVGAADLMPEAARSSVGRVDAVGDSEHGLVGIGSRGVEDHLVVASEIELVRESVAKGADGGCIGPARPVGVVEDTHGLVLGACVATAHAPPLAASVAVLGIGSSAKAAPVACGATFAKRLHGSEADDRWRWWGLLPGRGPTTGGMVLNGRAKAGNPCAALPWVRHAPPLNQRAGRVLPQRTGGPLRAGATVPGAPRGPMLVAAAARHMR